MYPLWYNLGWHCRWRECLPKTAIYSTCRRSGGELNSHPWGLEFNIRCNCFLTVLSANCVNWTCTVDTILPPLAFRFSCQWLSWLSWVHVCMHNYCPSNHSTGMSKSLCILSLGTVVCCITCHQILSQDPPTVYNLPTVTEGVSTHPEPLLLICSCIMEDTSWGCASSDVMPIPLISIKAHLEINVSSRLKRVQPAM